MEFYTREIELGPNLFQPDRQRSDWDGFKGQSAGVSLPGQRYEEPLADQIGAERRSHEHDLLARGPGWHVRRSVVQHPWRGGVFRRKAGGGFDSAQWDDHRPTSRIGDEKSILTLVAISNHADRLPIAHVADRPSDHLAAGLQVGHWDRHDRAASICGDEGILAVQSRELHGADGRA